MLPPLANALIKTLGKGFYRAHSGLLLFFFITILIYFFFIGVLNETHIPPDQVIFYNLILVLSFVSSPIITAPVFIVWLVYTIKSCNYITDQLLISSNQYLFYSSTSLSKANQLKNWFMLQSVILLPLIVYGIFSMVIGIIFNHYLIPLISLLYLLGLTLASSIFYVWYMNQLGRFGGQTFVLKKVRKWRKPFFSLFLYHIFDKLKFSYAVTKIFCWVIIAAFFHLFPEEIPDMRLKCMIVLSIVLAHMILIFESYKFEKTYLNFSRNLPYRRIRIFFNYGFLYLLLLLPENAWILLTFGTVQAAGLILLGLSTALLCHCLLYVIGLTMNKFIRLIFGLFILMFFIIMFHLFWILVPLNLFASFLMFNRKFYQQEPVTPH